MTAVALHQSEFSLKSASNYPIILLAQIDCMRSLTRVLEMCLVLRSIFSGKIQRVTRVRHKIGIQKIAAASGIVSIMQASLCFRSSICHSQFHLTAKEHLHPAKLRSTFSLTWSSAHSRVLMKVLLNFLLPTFFLTWSSANSQ